MLYGFLGMQEVRRAMQDELAMPDVEEESPCFKPVPARQSIWGLLLSWVRYPKVKNQVS